MMKTRLGICQRKRTFATRDEAEQVAAKAPFKLRAYTCSLCRRYHLTSRTKGMKTPAHELARTAEACDASVKRPDPV